MKKVLLALALIVMSSAAHASCNPKVAIGADVDSNNDVEFGIKLTWDLGYNAKCDQEAADAKAKEAKAEQEELKYLEKMFALCTKVEGTKATVIINKCKAEGFL